MPPNRHNIDTQKRRPFSSPHSQSRSAATLEHNNSNAGIGDYFVLTSLGLIAILGLALITQTDVIYSGPVLLTYLSALLIHRLIKKTHIARASKDDHHVMQERRELYVSAAQMVDLMPMAAALLDKRNRVSHANIHAQKIIGIQNTNRPLTHYIRDLKLAEHLSMALSGHQPEAFMTKIDSPSERYIRLLFSTAQPLDDGTSQSLTLVIFDDVTDVQLNQKLRADFLANASHELKTPIASLMGYIETLQTHAKDDPKARKKFLAIMYEQAERMERLINDLLSLRQIEQAAHIIPTGTADLNLAVLSAIDSVAPMSDKRSVTIQYDTTVVDTQFRGNQDEAVQMCLNILSNALKISAPDSQVNITLTALNNWHDGQAFTHSKLNETAHQRRIVKLEDTSHPCLQLTISDTGPGFARQHIPRIGERFYRVVGDLSSHEKGTGLGLAIVKHIVKRHRGGFYIRSQKGQGTEFSIVIMNAESSDKP
ncbi:MAG: ATP-binding protein [Litorimonas sp.]